MTEPAAVVQGRVVVSALLGGALLAACSSGSAPGPSAPLDQPFLDAGSATDSLLYEKVTAPPCGQRMPLFGTPLTNAQTDLIARWINGGALNN